MMERVFIGVRYNIKRSENINEKRKFEKRKKPFFCTGCKKGETSKNRKFLVPLKFS